jgi:hypothetical protein
MRRKIEKYLGKKQGCDPNNIRYTEDGRFDFMGDLEGVLAAVRGKEGSARRGKDRDSKRKKPRHEDRLTPHPGSAMMPMPYAPYGLAPNGFPRGPPMHMLGKDGKPLPPKTPYGYSPWQAPHMHMPPSATTTNSSSDSSMSPFNVNSMDSTPSNKANLDFAAGCFSSARKSVFDSFDSPKSLGGNLGLNMMSPSADMNVQGMTPMSSLQDTFATPFQKDMMSSLSPGGDDNLNKMLFADDTEYHRHDSFLKTPEFQAPKDKCRIHYEIGNDASISTASMGDMRINRVSISPISQNVANASFFSEGDNEIKSCFKSLAEVSLDVSNTCASAKKEMADTEDEDKEKMPPPPSTAAKLKLARDFNS